MNATTFGPMGDEQLDVFVGFRLIVFCSAGSRLTCLTVHWIGWFSPSCLLYVWLLLALGMFVLCFFSMGACSRFRLGRFLSYGKGSWVINFLSGCLRMVLRSCPPLLAFRQRSLLDGSAVWLRFFLCWQLGWAGFWFKLSLWFSCYIPAFIGSRELLPLFWFSACISLAFRFCFL